MINSKEYWDRRFAGDWAEKAGNLQSHDFMESLLTLLPEVVLEEIVHETLSFLDCGCAEGDGTAVLAKRFPNSKVAGFDFSDVAIGRARTLHGDVEFFVSTIEGLDRTADIAISSNCFEHLERPLPALRRLFDRARRYVILMTPLFERAPLEPEHVRVVHDATFPRQVGHWGMTYRIVTPPMPTWSQCQLIQIWEAGAQAAAQDTTSTSMESLLLEIAHEIGSISPGELTRDLVATQTGLRQMLQEMTVGTGEEAAERTALRLAVHTLREQTSHQGRTNERLSLALAAANETIHLGERGEALAAAEAAELRNALRQRDEKLAQHAAEIARSARREMRVTRAVSGLQSSNDRLRRKSADSAASAAALRHSLTRAQREIGSLRVELEQSRTELGTLERNLEWLQSHSDQQGNGIEWLRGEVATRDRALEKIHTSRWWRLASVYWRICDRMASIGRLLGMHRFRRGDSLPVEASAQNPDQARMDVALALPQTWDVIILPLIGWSFRFQRPQHLASHFARRGHRVFWIAPTDFQAPGSIPSVMEVAPNVRVVTMACQEFDIYRDETSGHAAGIIKNLRWLRQEFNISSAVVMTEIATWTAAALEARELFGWRLVYDCMDEWNTFPGIAPKVLSEEERLVAAADLVTVTAKRLFHKWNAEARSIVLARNGVDFEYFHRAPSGRLADCPGPIVGYFGAIAEWFDVDLVVTAARERPDYTFVLIGVSSVDVSHLESLPNVRLMGNQPYETIPSFLRDFDACIIPFKINAVTRSTDPVKFYEYISQGKPVVATAMDELFIYRDYLYIAEDTWDFVRKIDTALAEADGSLAEQRVELARSNTWAQRVEVMAQSIAKAHAKVSILVVTYNNLDYTKACLRSLFRNTLYPRFEVIVIDNASTDGSRQFLTDLQKEEPRLSVILNERNHGFAAANNQGLARAAGEMLVLLNNDTVVPNGWLGRLIAHLADAEIGLVVPTTNFSGNESRIDVPYDDIEGVDAFAAARSRSHDGQRFEIPVAAMYCLAMRRPTFEEIGFLDEEFGTGMFEDDDYSLRARRAGYRVVCADDAFVHHFGQASFSKLSSFEYRRVWDRNQAYFERKWGIQWQPHRRRGEERDSKAQEGRQ